MPEIQVNHEALKILKDDIECKTGFKFIKIEDGLAVSELELEEEHFNPYGIPYGGVLFTMADDTAGVAFISAGGVGVTVCGHVDYLRGARNAQKFLEQIRPDNIKAQFPRQKLTIRHSKRQRNPDHIFDSVKRSCE